MYEMCMKHKQILCVDLSPIQKISHYIYANIPESGEVPNPDTSGPKHSR
jgi:hypothetical protein